MFEITRTAAFDTWLSDLNDLRARIRILDRLERAAAGNLGNAKFFSGVGELKISYGPGYRVYFVRRGEALLLLLCGGDKRTQKKDIKRALTMVKELEK